VVLALELVHLGLLVDELLVELLVEGLGLCGDSNLNKGIYAKLWLLTVWMFSRKGESFSKPIFLASGGAFLSLFLLYTCALMLSNTLESLISDESIEY
jgi:hypothetical protein